MTDNGIYNTQNKAHRKRHLGYTGNETQRNGHLKNTVQDKDRVNNKNRN
jgi:hypothetical protein